jgi:glutathione S-transferase
MLTLYYSPGACSLASHLALEESGAAYEPKQILISKGEQNTPEYRRINPRGKVPALAAEDGAVIVENVAILTYLARRFPEARLMPTDPVGEAHCLSMMAWLSNTVHPAFTRIFRPERFIEDESAFPGVKESGRKAFWANLQELDGLLDGKPWTQGAQFTVCDGYALVFYAWATRIDLPVAELKNYTALKDRMLERPAVRTVLGREKNVLLPAAAA